MKTKIKDDVLKKAFQSIGINVTEETPAPSGDGKEAGAEDDLSLLKAENGDLMKANLELKEKLDALEKGSNGADVMAGIKAIGTISKAILDSLGTHTEEIGKIAGSIEEFNERLEKIESEPLKNKSINARTITERFREEEPDGKEVMSLTKNRQAVLTKADALIGDWNDPAKESLIKATTSFEASGVFGSELAKAFEEAGIKIVE